MIYKPRPDTALLALQLCVRSFWCVCVCEDHEESRSGKRWRARERERREVETRGEDCCAASPKSTGAGSGALLGPLGACCVTNAFLWHRVHDPHCCLLQK